MRIGCLGWGSLIWKPDDLPVQKVWFSDGPLLPIEFTRHSSGNRITLVLTPGVNPVRSLWTLMSVIDLQSAKRELARRECIKEENIQRSIGYWTKEGQNGDSAEVIGEWAARMGLDAVVWTALPPKSQEQINRVPPVEEVVSLLRDFRRRGQSDAAEEYVRKAPKQIDTDYRRRIEADLGWTPLGMTEESAEISRIQKRIDAEDSLLHSRTTIFLVSNGLLLASLGIQAYGRFRLVFVLLGLLLTMVWALIGWQSWRIIREFHIEREQRFADALEVQVAKRALPKPGPIRPVDLTSRWLPQIFLLTWILAGLFVLIKG